jgi:16S rRNA A1518/A1519 N6-dimethyltransferase RsmA/KsgA/DIM1 with predicted DNA glycosylase/AP lyase activity
MLKEVALCEDFSGLMKLVRTGFNQRRKMLSNSLSPYFNQNGINTSDFPNLAEFMNMRPEALSVNDFIRLYDIIKG